MPGEGGVVMQDDDSRERARPTIGAHRAPIGADASAPLLSLADVSVGYNGQALLDHVDLDVRPGEVLCLIGPNGAGKTTLLRSVARQMNLIGGSVVLMGKDLAALSARELARRMSLVSTDHPRPHLLTCYDVVAAGRYPYTGSLGLLAEADERAVERALAAVNGVELGPQAFTQISDGQRQRVMIARALAQEPAVMVLDEPTSYLDVRYKLDLLSILRKLSRERGIAVVMSLHEIDLAMKVADTVACVAGDRVERTGPPEEVLGAQAVARLFGIGDRAGSFDPLFGSTELAPPAGDPRVLVVSNGGRGVPVYRRLQRAGCPFAAGVLFENDIDYRLARLIASEVVCAQPFRPIPDEALNHVLHLVQRVEEVIDAGCSLEGEAARLEEVLARARACGKLVSLPDQERPSNRPSRYASM